MSLYSLLVTLALVAAAAAQETPAVGDVDDAGFTLVWADEFNTDGPLDQAKWSPVVRLFVPWADSLATSDYAACADGVLSIEARRETVQNPWYEVQSERYENDPLYEGYRGNWLFKPKREYHCTFGEVQSNWRVPRGAGRIEMRVSWDQTPGFRPYFSTRIRPAAGFVLGSYWPGGSSLGFSIGSPVGFRYQYEMPPKRLELLEGRRGMADVVVRWDESDMDLLVDGELVSLTDRIWQPFLDGSGHPLDPGPPAYTMWDHQIVLGFKPTTSIERTQLARTSRFEVDYIRMWQSPLESDTRPGHVDPWVKVYDHRVKEQAAP